MAVLVGVVVGAVLAVAEVIEQFSTSCSKNALANAS